MQAPSRGLAPDSPVPGAECWYRLLTNKDHVTKDGTVHYQALKGKAFQVPKTRKPWSHELSGCLSSLVADINGQAETVINSIYQQYMQRGQSIPSKIQFAGVACAFASELRAGNEIDITTDVIYTPLPTDNAHSDFVTYRTTSDEELNPVRDWLKKTLRVIKPQDLEARIASCG